MALQGIGRRRWRTRCTSANLSGAQPPTDTPSCHCHTAHASGVAGQAHPGPCARGAWGVRGGRRRLGEDGLQVIGRIARPKVDEEEGRRHVRPIRPTARRDATTWACRDATTGRQAQVQVEEDARTAEAGRAPGLQQRSGCGAGRRAYPDGEAGDEEEDGGGRVSVSTAACGRGRCTSACARPGPWRDAGWAEQDGRGQVET